jgi:hypothetical protein
LYGGQEAQISTQGTHMDWMYLGSERRKRLQDIAYQFAAKCQSGDASPLCAAVYFLVTTSSLLTVEYPYGVPPPPSYR